MKSLLPLLAVLALTACAQIDPGCAALPLSARYCLQPSTDASPFSVRQQVSARFKGQREMLIADIENRSDGLAFVGLTPFGLTVFQVAYDNRTTTAARLPDTRISPELLLGMLQLALWPADSVRRGLGDAAKVEDGPGQRRIFIDKQLLMEMRHDDTAAPYRHMQIHWPAIDMELDIRALAEQETS
jgi:hypothetical protein